MSKHIDLVFTAPPSMDAPMFIGVLDDTSAEMQIGVWLQPDNDFPFWRYRLGVAEILHQMVVGTSLPAAPVLDPAPVMPTPAQIDQARAQHKPVVVTPNKAVEAKASLRERLRGLKPKQAAQPTAAQPAAAPEPALEQSSGKICADCEKPRNPDSFRACPACGDDKCSVCIPMAGSPCLTCQALYETPGQGGFDPSAVPDDPKLARAIRKADALEGSSGAPFNERMFDGKFHAQGGAVSEAEDEDD